MSGSNAKVGIDIVVTGEQLNTLIKKLHEADQAAKDTQATGKKMDKALDITGSIGSYFRLRQVMRVLHTAMLPIREAANLVQASLQFRTPYIDATSRAMREIHLASMSVVNTLVDMLAPAFSGVSEALKPVVKEVNNWIKANQTLVKTQFSEWVLTALKLTKYLVLIVEALRFSLTGIAIVYYSLKAAFLEWYELVFTGMERLVAQFIEWGPLLRTLGQKDIADFFDRLGIGIAVSKKESTDWKNTANKNVKDQIQHLRDLTTEYNSLSARIDKFQSDAEKAMKKNIGKTGSHTGEETEKEHAKAVRDNAMASVLLERAFLRVRIATEQMNAKFAEAERQENQFTKDFIRNQELLMRVGSPAALAQAWVNFERDRGNITREAEHEQLKVLQDATAKQVKELNSAAEEMHGPIFGLVEAWQNYAEAAPHLSGEASKEIVKDLTNKTMELGTKIAEIATSIVTEFRTAFQSVGEIVTDSEQKIAIKSGTRILKYVNDISAAQIKAQQKLGHSVETVTETMRIHTKTAMDAIGDALKALLDNLLNQIISFMAQAIVKTFLKLAIDVATGGAGSAAGGGGGFLGTLAGIVGKAKGGPIGYGDATSWKGFASGGHVTGGIPGRDSVPAVLTPGEFVLPVDVVDSIRRGKAPPSRKYAAGGPVDAATSPNYTNGNAPPPQQVIVVRNEQHFFAPFTQTQFQRQQRDVVDPVVRRMRKNGFASGKTT
jgi:hypothetical protein